MKMDQAEKLRKLVASRGTTTDKKRGMRIITVASGKGGVGKTNIVVNLAIALSKQGKRVMILDADLGMANVDILFGIIPDYTLSDVFEGRKKLHEIIMTGPEGVRIIPGGSGIHELAHLRSTQRDELIRDLRDFSETIDFLLIDSGAGISKNVLGFIAAADDVIVVVTPEPTSITDAYGIIKILSRFHLHKEVYLLVNRARDEREAVETMKKIKTVADKFLDITVNNLGFISDDSVVGKSVKEQKPFIITYPRCLAAKDLVRVATDFMQCDSTPPQGAQNFITKLMRLFR